MAPNIDIFDTYYMLGSVQEIVPSQTFFLSRYFPTGAGDIFKADKVLVEYRDGDRRLAPFVVPRVGDFPIARRGYEVKEYQPPDIRPSRLLTLDDLQKRGFGEAILSNSTQAQRAQALLLQDLSELDARITRREEWMAAQCMVNNGYVMQAYIDNLVDTEAWDIYFYDVALPNPATYVVPNAWDAAQGDFFGDVSNMCAMLADRGLPAADLVVSSDVGQIILGLPAVTARLDNRRMEFGSIAPKNLAPGVTWLGKLNFNGFDLDIFSVYETYVDDAGLVQPYFPAKSAMVTAPGCGHMMYGQITQIEPDEQYHTFAAKRVPKFVVDRDKDLRKVRLGARPLAAPRQRNPWIYAANAIT